MSVVGDTIGGVASYLDETEPAPVREEAKAALPCDETKAEQPSGRRGRESGGETFGEPFHRDLAEVYLLFDFISGRTEKSLSELKGACAFDGAGIQVPDMPAQRVVEEICKISCQPDDSIRPNAQQAALMLIVKDQLNRIASPARGLTVAFTSMFAGVSLTYRDDFYRPWNLFRKQVPSHQEQFFYARAAYPNLERHARSFRRLFGRLPWFALAVIMFVVWANWDINVTSAILVRIAKANSDYSALFVPGKPFYPTTDTCWKPTAPEQLICDQAAFLRKKAELGRANLAAVIENNWLLHPVAIGVHLFHPVELAEKAAPRATGTGGPSGTVEMTLGVIGGFNTILIPTLFGWLGTMAGLLRSTIAKVNDSILSPRDYCVAQVALLLGMLAGLAVGLFFNAGNSADIAKQLGGTISISQAGLSFVAGFGAEAFFSFLDRILAKLLPSAQAPAAKAVAK